MLIAATQKRLYNFEVQDYFKQSLKTAWPILASAGTAAAFAFAQSIAAHSGFCPAPTLSIETTSLLGGMIKAGHTVAKGLITGSIT